jgi:hypothetical protein
MPWAARPELTNALVASVTACGLMKTKAEFMVCGAAMKRSQRKVTLFAQWKKDFLPFRRKTQNMELNLWTMIPMSTATQAMLDPEAEEVDGQTETEGLC